MIRAVVAEDSDTVRELLVRILEGDPSVRVVGEARNGLEAVEMAQDLRPDVVTMDIRMPGCDGFEATRRIMVETPLPIVILSGSLDLQEVEISMHALRVGALAVLAKPPGPETPEFEDRARAFVAKVKAMSAVKVVRRWGDRSSPLAAPGLPVWVSSRRAEVLALAASTGGPAALHRILSDLPGDLRVPLLIVQHMSEGFVEGFAAWLNEAASFRVKLAEAGEPLLPRTAYLPPSGRHLGLADRNHLLLSDAAPIGGFRPSANYLFDSVARVFGPSSVAVVLTGMGVDGVEGLRSIRASGGRVLVQDETTSVVFGMPQAAVAAGMADAVVPLESIARYLGAIGRDGEVRGR